MARHKDKLVIGLAIEDQHTDFAMETIRSALFSIPKNRDVRLVVLAGKHDESTDREDTTHRYKLMYNTVYQMEEMYRFDGLIIVLGGMRATVGNIMDLKNVENFHIVPKVYAASPKDMHPCVNYDNEMGIRDTIDYLINVNGYSEICMLGGREDNADAVERREIYIRALEANHVPFSETMFEATDMSVNSQENAIRLLRRNPNVQAIFCVNDAVAEALYEVMHSRGLVPGRDIQVFGFDNTVHAGEMTPTLASIGATGAKMGQIAMTMLLDLIDGREVESVTIPTKLYGKESLNYEVYDYTTAEMVRGRNQFIHDMFDECFYRYQSEIIKREAVDLRRLYYEIISRMIKASKMRYMSVEEFQEIGRMIDVFFKNNAMNYTDATKFIRSIERIQTGMYQAQKSVAATVLINRLFLRMKDMAIRALSENRIRENRMASRGRTNVQDFLITMADERLSGSETMDKAIRTFDKLGFENASLVLYNSPVHIDIDHPVDLPGHVRICCVMKSGELYIIPRDRQECLVTKLFEREDIMSGVMGQVVIPIFYSRYLYGFLLCDLSTGDAERGEYIAGQLGKVFYIAHQK